MGGNVYVTLTPSGTLGNSEENYVKGCFYC